MRNGFTPAWMPIMAFSKIVQNVLRPPPVESVASAAFSLEEVGLRPTLKCGRRLRKRRMWIPGGRTLRHFKTAMALMLCCIFCLLSSPLRAQEGDFASSGFDDDDMVMGACCLNNGVCYNRTRLLCDIWGGIHFPGLECEEVSCPSNCGGGCSTGEVYDCYGHCVPVSWIGDGECDNGQYQHDSQTIYLNCEEFGWDGGDCTPPDNVPNSPGRAASAH